tara:strand:- start:187 stop:4839 length:4653 start_codon:yes stop_codon:yes gene_type:complete
MSESPPPFLPPTSLTGALDDLRTALTDLKPTGQHGFEGLLARVLSTISGQDFRLAKSGLQFGKDGETLASTSPHISFEAKLYTGDIPATEVHGKITQLIGSSAPPDIWVLGATVEAGTQLLDPMQSAAEKNGIAILVLDWPHASDIPPLAAACAMAPDETNAFLKEQIANAQVTDKADAALSVIRSAPSFQTRASVIHASLSDPTAGIAIARTANRRWLEIAFSDRRVAKDAFGQALAPGAPASLHLQPRPALVETVQNHITKPPQGTIIALVGGDGFGKSWLFAQSWLALEDKPLTLVISATDIKSVAAYGSFLPVLIAKLIQQTNGVETDETRRRWERKFKYWKELPHEHSPRFIVFIDGLNEQKDVNWSRWIDGAAAVIEQHGGALIVSVRSAYYDECLRTSLHSAVTMVCVPEWTQAHLKEILRAEGVNPEDIKSAVLARLCNPRILGIAFELKDSVQIQDFAELSVERLLFEHIRIGQRDGTPPESREDFAKRLAEHAQEILNRACAQSGEHLLFDRARQGDNGYALTAELLAVAGENFFKPLPEDPTLYTLPEDGLNLALGLSIVRSLKRATLAGRSASEALERLIEPVAALDKTADAVFSAMLVSSADDRCPTEIQRALIGGFLRLQNIDASNYPPFRAVVRKSTDAALFALVDLSGGSHRSDHKDWLLGALRACRSYMESWAIISKHISKWLRTFSLDPRIAIMSVPGHDTTEKIAKETEDRTKVLGKRLADMTPEERTFMQNYMLQDDDCVPATLAEEALTLLAGMELTPFALDLVAYSYSHQLNSSYHAPYDEFIALLRFNRKDWNAMRVALLEATSFLNGENISRTGKWALVALLRGLSTADDAALETRLVKDLTQDRQYPKGWRLVEKYCATDPCDPGSIRPDNIDQTAEQYRQIKIEEVSKNRSMGAEDHFIRDARPGLARFVPEVAIDTQRNVVASIASRDPTDLMLGVTSLEVHSAVLESESVSKLLDIARTLSAPRGPDVERAMRDEWITAQYAIQIAFAHLDGNEQLDFLISLPPHGPPLLKLANVLKPAAPDKLEQALEQALSSGEHCRQLVALMFACDSGSDLTDRSLELIGQQAQDKHTSVRAEALNIVAYLKDKDLIQQVIDSGWSATALDRRRNHFEAWYGSSVMIEAARLELLTTEDALDRIIPERYGYAAQFLGETAHVSIAARLKAAVAVAINITLPFAPPVVEQNLDNAQTNPPLWSLAEPDEVLGPQAFFKRMNETPEDFEARQRQGWEAFNRFQDALSDQHARLIVEDIRIDGVRVFAQTESECALNLGQQILTMDEAKLMHIQNFALMLAQCLSQKDLGLARSMFERLSGRRAFVNLTYGYSAVPLEAMCVWSSSDSPELDELRTRRLDSATTDYHIAQEVRAALMAGKADFLECYVNDNLERPEPAANARALMVLGFGAQSQTTEETLARYANAGGLVGKAYQSARFAYDRDKWSRHWFEEMCRADSGEEYWRLSTLFLKIVDSRYSEWEADISREGGVAAKFEPTIQDKIEHRIKTWKAKREKTLCGDKTPGEIFVVLD